MIRSLWMFLSVLLLLLHAGNVLVVGETLAQRTFKVCDFGLSRMLDGEGGVQGERGRSITGGMGTSKWMAPEVIVSDGLQLDAHPYASDVYSFAVLAWQVLAGEQPYAGFGGSLHQLKQEVMAGLRPEMPHNAEEWGWPEDALKMIESCWLREAGERPSFVEVSRKLSLMEAEFERLAPSESESEMEAA